jgi:hypothetical protein
MRMKIKLQVKLVLRQLKKWKIKNLQKQDNAVYNVYMTLRYLGIGIMLAVLLASTLTTATALGSSGSDSDRNNDSESIEERNSDDTMMNDTPPVGGEDVFCDIVKFKESCYDRNDNPEAFCVANPQYTKFCEIIGPICDEEGEIQDTEPECTPEDEPCPENYVRYNEYCSLYRVECDENSTNVYCTGQRRTDGLIRCEDPNHPGSKFCTAAVVVDRLPDGSGCPDGAAKS